MKNAAKKWHNKVNSTLNECLVSFFVFLLYVPQYVFIIKYSIKHIDSYYTDRSTFF